jgi:phosphoribosylglycinamide formyltransferase-1
LLTAFPPGDPLGSVALVISNRATAGALVIAEAHGVAARHIPFGRDRKGFEHAAGQALDQAGIDLICLAGFMRVLSPAFIERYAGRILNIHPSLLPAFPGLNAQRQALEAGVSVSGCTVHWVDAGVDSGPIVLQRQVPVYPDDTALVLSGRILDQEHRLYPEAVRLVLQGGIP